MKVSSVPPTTPGRDSGQVIFQKLIHELAYRSPEAASRLRSIFSSEVYRGSVMNGRKLYVRPRITADGVASTRPSVRPSASVTVIRPLDFIKLTTAPRSARICRQASVRIRNEVKNGATTRANMNVRQRPAFMAMVYAKG